MPSWLKNNNNKNRVNYETLIIRNKPQYEWAGHRMTEWRRQ